MGVSLRVFTLVYTPVNAKYWIAPSVCLWIVFIALWLDAARHKRLFRSSRVVLAILVALMFVVSFVGSIRFTRNRDNDYYYSQIQPLLERSNVDDLIVLGGSEKLQAYLRRYGKVRSVLLTSVSETSNANSECVLRVESAIEEELAAGGTVLISRDGLVPGQETIRRYRGIIAFRSLWNRYSQRWITREFRENTVYILQPRKAGGLTPHLETYRVTVGR